MYYIKNDSTNPYFNHSLEEYFIKNFKEECFILWRNEPCILIGRNQNTVSEINVDYVRKNGIKIVRRLTGGGAVFNDLGNINFTFITNIDENADNSFIKFAQPVIDSLNSLGIKAEFSGRNDITVDGKKISGNARYYYRNRLLHHGTLLFSGDLSTLRDALKSKPLKFKGKNIKSVKSRVTNISEHLKADMDVLEFREFLMQNIIKEHNIKSIYTFSEEDYRRIEDIQKNRFETYEWNYGSSPEFSISNEYRFPCGTVEMGLDVKDGVIKKLKIYGDFFGKKDISELEMQLYGIRYMYKPIVSALENTDIDDYIQGMNKKEMIEKLLIV